VKLAAALVLAALTASYAGWLWHMAAETIRAEEARANRDEVDHG
jgi:hypothetical protein